MDDNHIVGNGEGKLPISPECTHLAIFHQPFLDLILNGEKTIESRFSKTKIAPYNHAKEGDRVLLKQSGGNILGEFTIKKVVFYEVNADSLMEIKKYNSGICANREPDFWSKRSEAKYATLMFIENVIKYATPCNYSKQNRLGWVKAPCLNGCDRFSM